MRPRCGCDPNARPSGRQATVGSRRTPAPDARGRKRVAWRGRDASARATGAAPLSSARVRLHRKRTASNRPRVISKFIDRYRITDRFSPPLRAARARARVAREVTAPVHLDDSTAAPGATWWPPRPPISPATSPRTIKCRTGIYSGERQRCDLTTDNTAPSHDGLRGFALYAFPHKSITPHSPVLTQPA